MLRRTPFGWDTYLRRIQDALAVVNEHEDGCVFRVSMGIKKTNTAHTEELYFTEYESPEHRKESITNIFSKVEGIELAEVFSALDAHGPENMPIIHISDSLSLSVKPIGNWRRIVDIAISGNCEETEWCCSSAYDVSQDLELMSDRIAKKQYGGQVDMLLSKVLYVRYDLNIDIGLIIDRIKHNWSSEAGGNSHEAFEEMAAEFASQREK